MAKPKILLLPGLDGAGNFFDELTSLLFKYECEVISYPNELADDYDVYVRYVKSRISNENTILVAESFSGAIAAKVSSDPRIVGVIFLASFLDSPVRNRLRKLLILIAPILFSLPKLKWALRAALFGGKENLDWAQSELSKIKPAVLFKRIKMVCNLSKINCNAPYIALHGKQDRLIKSPIEGAVLIDGPHALSYCSPEACAHHILNFAKQFDD